MKTSKKIVAWVAAIVSIIGMVIAVAGIFGSWVLYSNVTNVTLSLLTAGDNVVMAASNGVNRLDERLDVSQQRIDTVDDKVISLGEELEDTSLLGTAIANTIGDDLIPILEAVGDTAAMIRDTATAVDDAIQAINDIPFVSLDGIFAEANIFAEIADSITAIETSIEETQKEVQERREDRIEDMVDRVTGKTDEWRGKVTGVQNKLGEADAALADSSDNLAALKISLPRTFMLITIAVNLLFLLIGIAFLSLFFHGFSYIRNPEQSLNELLL
jgi:hypothetical protein